MPPTPARPITSFFNKVPTPSKPTSPERVKALSSSTAAAPSSPLSSVVGSSPAAKVSGVKRGLLSDAAKRAIEEGIAEGNQAKRLKLDDDTSKCMLHLLYWQKIS